MAHLLQCWQCKLAILTYSYLIDFQYVRLHILLRARTGVGRRAMNKPLLRQHNAVKTLRLATLATIVLNDNPWLSTNAKNVAKVTAR
jgi:hypothetical protein